MGTEVSKLIAATIAAHVAAEARVVRVQERERGAQGYSEAMLRYYDVEYAAAGAVGQVTLVVKEAPLVERRTLAWLGARGLAVPFSYTPDLTSDALVPICMQYTGDVLPAAEQARQTARALAAIHFAGLGRDGELSWVPRADPAFLGERLVDTCWRRPWRHRLFGEGYINWGGRHIEDIVPDSKLQAALAPYTTQLEDVAGHFLRDMMVLWEEGDALTLIHADLHGGNVHAVDGRASILDWEHARYGPLYIDLPNYFSREQALLYRDALAELGHHIPTERFLAGYDVANPYVGLKYFGFGVTDWYAGDPPRPHPNSQYWIDMVLKGTSIGRRSKLS
jgi:hypothetical protein